MNTAPVVPARIEFNAEGVPFSPDYFDIYHPKSGALRQARHVFLGGNELPRRWQGRARFTVLETGFGLGNNFLATWDAWRSDPSRADRLVFVSIEQHPLTRDDLVAMHRDSPLAALADELCAAWPESTHNLHRLGFDDGRVELLLAFGDVQSWLPEIVAEVDAFYLDGFAPARNPRMWDARVCKALGRLAAPGATLASWTAARAVRADLRTAGFEVRLGAGTGGKRDITLARFAPTFMPRRAAGRATGSNSGRNHLATSASISASASPSASAPTSASLSTSTSTSSLGVETDPAPAANADERRALIVGGGLAGCAAAWALSQRGWKSSIFERRTTIAAEASGNPAGLFHGIVNAQDGIHARFNRAASMMAAVEIRTAIERHGAAGAVAGMLRLETGMDVDSMRSMLARLGLPPGYVAAIDAAAAASLAGMPLRSTVAAWHYPNGGWVHPAGLARSFIERAGAAVDIRTDRDVKSIDHEGGLWRLLDATGRVIDAAGTLILANAGAALDLLGCPDWTMTSRRGQISLLAADAAAAAAAAHCRIPVAGSGYLLPPHDGLIMFGATSQQGDADGSVRDADHEANLRQLRTLTGLPLDVSVAALDGRTAWRWTTGDRLPIVGAVPDLHLLGREAKHSNRWDQPRFVPREPGLFVFTALGSRGITWSALCAQTLAATIAGSSLPIEASLMDAIDPARFVSRAVRRAAGTGEPDVVGS